MLMVIILETLRLAPSLKTSYYRTVFVGSGIAGAVEAPIERLKKFKATLANEGSQ